PLDPSAFTFVNPDLTVYLERPPQGAWFGFDIRSTASGEGMGLSQSSVRDCEGVVARSAQSLVVATRPG
ncbi:MAG: thioesterase family protein, partial [Nannocystaceae bacterium]